MRSVTGKKRSVILILVSMITLAPLSSVADCNSEEVGYIATFDITKGDELAFETAIAKLIETVLRVEKGILLYALYKGDDGTYYILERYKDAAALAAHAKSPEVRAVFGPVIAATAGPPELKRITAVCSKEPQGGEQQ